MGTPSPPTQRFLTRRSFLRLSAASLGGLALYAGEVSRHELSLEQHTIHLERLPDGFRGLRIVQVSDFHYDEYTEPYFVREVVRRVNGLRADVVVLTGDFVSYGPLPFSFARTHARQCAALLSEIACPLRYGILGNHDEVVGAAYVTGPMREHGIQMLVNEWTVLERGGERVWLAGLGSACTDNSKPERGIPKASVTRNDAVIVLAHEPDILPEIAGYGVDLMLSGHTHGGQVRLPFLPPLQLPNLGKNYVEGLFRHGRTQLYVNRGLGTVGVPFRLDCPPEITVLTLV